MKIHLKILSVILVFIGLPAFAAEAPVPTFPIWGGVNENPTGYYNVIKGLSGQEFVGVTVKCFNGGETGVNDTFVVRAPIYNAVTGAKQYDLVFSTETPNSDPLSEECYFSNFGQGIAVSGSKRIIVLGAVAGDGYAVISTYNAENGVPYYTKKFLLSESEDYLLEFGEHSSVGKFISSKSDQLRVTYTKYVDGSVLHKVTYYDVLTGNETGNPLSITVPAPVLP